METKQHQIISIHGGGTFESKEEFHKALKQRDYDPYVTRPSWKQWLKLTLIENYEFFLPQMPNSWFADYQAWKIWFEKLFPYINKQSSSKIILLGHSLGGIFLVKYLSENSFPKHIDQLHLVAPVFDNEGIVDEKIASFEFNPNNLKNIEKQTQKIFLYHSKDDDVVPFSHSIKFRKHLKNLNFHKFEDRGHFLQATFIELYENIVKNI